MEMCIAKPRMHSVCVWLGGLGRAVGWTTTGFAQERKREEQNRGKKGFP